MKNLIAFSTALAIIFVFSTSAFCERKCTGILTVNSLHKDAKVAPGFIEADITFDSNTYACSGMTFAKTEKPTTRVAVLGLAPGLSKDLVKIDAKLKVEYESIYNDPESTMGLAPEWDEKWTVLGEDKSKPAAAS